MGEIDTWTVRDDMKLKAWSRTIAMRLMIAKFNLNQACRRAGMAMIENYGGVDELP